MDAYDLGVQPMDLYDTPIQFDDNDVTPTPSPKTSLKLHPDYQTITLHNKNNKPFDYPVSFNCMKGFEIKDLIGKGGYGSVSRGCHIQGGCDYALKTMIVEEDNLDEFQKESYYAKLFSDNNIGPKFFGAWVCKNEFLGIIVSELWDGSLKKGERIPKYKVLMLKDKIDRMHKLGYVHTDILEKNVLVKRNHEGTVLDIVLTDFGLANTFEHFINDPKWVKRLYDYHMLHPSSKKYFVNKNISLKDVQKDPRHLDYSLIYHLLDISTISGGAIRKKIIRKQCRATTRNGTRCKKNIAKGKHKYCKYHC